MSALLLAGRILAARLLMVASIALLASCTSEGNVNWTVTQTTPAPSSSPSCPPGTVAYPVAAARGFVCAGPDPTLSPAPSGVDSVPYCLPSDPPGSYCQQAP